MGVGEGRIYAREGCGRDGGERVREEREIGEEQGESRGSVREGNSGIGAP